MTKQPHIIHFTAIGDITNGYISIAENKKNIPFEVNRIFWTYYTPENIVRGRHAHYETQMILIAATGRIIVNTENQLGELGLFVLEHPSQGLYIPPLCWHTMQYNHHAVQMVLASTCYDEKDYIRDYTEFKKAIQP